MKMNSLDRINQKTHLSIISAAESVTNRTAERRSVPLSNYFIQRLKTQITSVLSPIIESRAIDVTRVERGKFDADFAIRVPDFLKSMGSGKYLKEVVPSLVRAIQESNLIQNGEISAVSGTGIYVNIRIGPKACSEIVSDVLHLSKNYGQTDLLHGKRILVDYSSPNAAKTLHAGHIRSTILGEVLSHLYEASDATVFRWNHINDLGGFGFLLEGFTRWKEKLPDTKNPNEKVAFVYGIHRQLQRFADEDFSKLTPPDMEIINRFLGESPSAESFKVLYQAYVDSSNAWYEKLENGEAMAVEIWSKIVEWSIDDYRPFYSLLDVQHDMTVGESFFGRSGTELVLKKAAEGSIIKYSATDAAAERQLIAERLASTEITPAIAETLLESVNRDVGAYVAQISQDRRVVVLRSDGRTIYTTRDLGCIDYRTKNLALDASIYVVGGEQREHFDSLFAVARKLDLVKPEASLLHIPFGFYLDAGTKKKLSSREGAAGVQRLLEGSVEYFRKKYENSEEFSETEKSKIARQLAVASIIINDIKKDQLNTVEISRDLEKAFKEFEESGGAYLVYAACRASSILKKYNASLPEVDTIISAPLLPNEFEILKLIGEFPFRLQNAVNQNTPSIIVGYLFDLARAYNSYYAVAPVIKGGETHEHRLLITHAVSQALRNGLKFCHIECPDRI